MQQAEGGTFAADLQASADVVREGLTVVAWAKNYQPRTVPVTVSKDPLIRVSVALSEGSRLQGA